MNGFLNTDQEVIEIIENKREVEVNFLLSVLLSRKYSDFKVDDLDRLVNLITEVCSIPTVKARNGEYIPILSPEALATLKVSKRNALKIANIFRHEQQFNIGDPNFRTCFTKALSIIDEGPIVIGDLIILIALRNNNKVKSLDVQCILNIIIETCNLETYKDSEGFIVPVIPESELSAIELSAEEAVIILKKFRPELTIQ